MATAMMHVLTPYLTTAGIGWLYYRRIRRHFGRQPWQPRRTWIRIALVGLVAAILVLSAVAFPHVAWAMLGGAVVGAGLGALAIRHTRIERDGNALYYVPNPWIGGSLSVLLVARLAWRWSHGAFSSGVAQTASQASPLTMGMASMLIAYSLLQGIGMMLRMRRLTTATGG